MVKMENVFDTMAQVLIVKTDGSFAALITMFPTAECSTAAPLGSTSSGWRGRGARWRGWPGTTSPRTGCSPPPTRARSCVWTSGEEIKSFSYYYITYFPMFQARHEAPVDPGSPHPGSDGPGAVLAVPRLSGHNIAGNIPCHKVLIMSCCLDTMLKWFG